MANIESPASNTSFSLFPLPPSSLLSLSFPLLPFSLSFPFHCFQVKAILDEILEKLPDSFNMMELFARAEDKTPYVLVALQECERMNNLTREIRRSLKELDLGLKVRSNL